MPLVPVLAVLAAALPSSSTPGVTATPGAGGRLAIHFADTAAGRAVYRRYAGRRVAVRCQRVSDDALYGAGPQRVVTTHAQMGATLSTVTLRLRGGVNLCSLGSPLGGVIVAADTAARRFLADFSGLSVLDVVDLVGRDGAAATLRRLGSHGVRLRSRTTTPSPGRIGIYGNRGTTHGAVFRSASGHRLFGEVSGDVVRTNVLSALFELADPPLPSGAALPTGPRPAPGTPLPATTDPEVTSTRDGGQAVIDFTGSARQDLAGTRVSVSCSASRQGIGVLSGTEESVSSDVFGPPAGKPLRVTVPARFHLCAVSFRSRLARVALDATGRAVLDEATVVAGLNRVVREAASGETTSYPSGQTLSDRFNGDVVALGGPGDTPPDRRIGAWSDGKRHLVLTAIAQTGRRLSIEVDGRTVSTDTFNVQSLPDAP